MKRWATNDDGSMFWLVGKTQDEVTPGVYSIAVLPGIGPCLASDSVRVEDVMRFPDGVVDHVVEEIQSFWGSGEAFARHGLPHKRGYLLYGPPGCGKSTALRLIATDVVSRGGIVLQYLASPFRQVYRAFRSAQPDTPIVVMMEDLDSIIAKSNESEVLNTLDGIGDMHQIVFVATTNYPENLSARIANRPSRFDRRIHIEAPSEAHRRAYLSSLVRPGDPEVDVHSWALDTEGLSFAHVKELFVSVTVLGADYDSTLKLLKSMSLPASSSDDDKLRGQYL